MGKGLSFPPGWKAKKEAEQLSLLQPRELIFCFIRTEFAEPLPLYERDGDGF